VGSYLLGTTGEEELTWGSKVDAPPIKLRRFSYAI